MTLEQTLAQAQAEARRGRLSADTAQRVRQALAELAAPRSRPHDKRLASRDETICKLSDLLPASLSTWRKAGAVAKWLSRWRAGDDLNDAPAEAGELVAGVGVALSRRQVFRILSGDRSA